MIGISDGDRDSSRVAPGLHGLRRSLDSDRGGIGAGRWTPSTAGGKTADDLQTILLPYKPNCPNTQDDRVAPC